MKCVGVGESVKGASAVATQRHVRETARRQSSGTEPGPRDDGQRRAWGGGEGGRLAGCACQLAASQAKALSGRRRRAGRECGREVCSKKLMAHHGWMRRPPCHGSWI